MKIVGITGNIASGKSTFCQIMSNVGPCRIIDADTEAHRLYELKPELVAEIGHVFGEQYVIDGKLQRRELGRLVFSQPEALKKLDELVHPHLMAHLTPLLAEENNDVECVILDAALLFELGYDALVHYVITVDADPQLRRERLVQKGLTAEEAKNRVEAQMPTAQKIEKSDWVVINEGSHDHLLKEAERIWEALLSC